MICDVCGNEHAEDRVFIVVLRRRVRSMMKYAPLLGPYMTHRDATDHLDEGNQLARQADPFAVFDDVGTAAVEPDNMLVRHLKNPLD